MNESIATATIDVTANTLPVESILRVIAHHATECADDLADLRYGPTTITEVQPTEAGRRIVQMADETDHLRAGLQVLAAPGCLNYSPGSPGLAADCWEAGRTITNSSATPCAPCIATKVLAHEELPT